MVAVTYTVARLTGAARSAVTGDGTGWVARFFRRLMDARMEQAHREIRKHAHLLPYPFETLHHH